MITIISTLYFWLIPVHPHEMILPDRQRVPRPPLQTNSYVIPADLTKRSKYKKSTNKSSRRILDR